jgi:hypothetical protein
MHTNHDDSDTEIELTALTCMRPNGFSKNHRQQSRSCGGDVKIPILESFAKAATGANSDKDENDGPRSRDGGLFSFQMQAQSLGWRSCDVQRATPYGAWVSCGVTQFVSSTRRRLARGTRATVCMECAGESTEEWIDRTSPTKDIAG